MMANSSDYLVLGCFIFQACNTPDGWRSHRHSGRCKVVDALLAEEAPNMAHRPRARLLSLPGAAHSCRGRISTCSLAAGSASLFRAIHFTSVGCQCTSSQNWCTSTSSVPARSEPMQCLTERMHQHKLRPCTRRAWACLQQVVRREARSAGKRDARVGLQAPPARRVPQRGEVRLAQLRADGEQLRHARQLQLWHAHRHHLRCAARHWQLALALISTRHTGETVPLDPCSMHASTISTRQLALTSVSLGQNARAHAQGGCCISASYN